MLPVQGFVGKLFSISALNKRVSLYIFELRSLEAPKKRGEEAARRGTSGTPGRCGACKAWSCARTP